MVSASGSMVFTNCPASVDLYSGPSYIVNAPADIATGAFNGNTDEWEYSPSMNGGTPSTSDVFTYNVTYTDGASNSTANSPSNPLTASPTAVLSAWATNMSPHGTRAARARRQHLPGTTPPAPPTTLSVPVAGLEPQHHLSIPAQISTLTRTASPATSRPPLTGASIRQEAGARRRYPA